MKSMKRISGRWCAIFSICAGLCAGCSGEWRTPGRESREDPYVQRALAKVREGDSDGAIEYLNKALDRSPKLATAHLELALLYDDARKDYIRAIYHYERYLELYPKTDKGVRIQEYINRAKMALASAMPSVDDRVRALQRENAELKRELLEVRRNMAAQYAAAREQAAAHTAKPPAPAAPGATVAKKPDEKARPAAGGEYQVKKGDTLSTIAVKAYGDPTQWRKIQEANKDKLGNSHLLKIGQTLVIPP